jgi:(S)-3,5-dihydroxyphenylglycine transaminase
MNALGQYGRTNGQIHAAVARHLRLDEGIDAPAEAIMVTTGCQEAFLVLLMGLFEPARDVLLVSDPTYIGITGLAALLGIPVRPVPMGPDGLEPDAVERAVARVKIAGKVPKAVYDVPDFNNPLGTSLPLARRRELLEVARRHDLLVFEDNAYGRFAYDGDPLPTLKALDGESGGDPVVVYLGTFSKTLYPGLRLGYLVADQRVEGEARGEGPYLAEELSRVKSLTTVNTSPIVQAIAGGVLAEHGGSLEALLAEKRAYYKGNRDAMLAALESSFRGAGPGPDQVRWNRPGGGFFLTVSLPFVFD